MKATCWAPGCESDLERDGSWWRCPKGCRIRDNVSQWTKDHIDYRQGSPAMRARFFGDLV